ncbi:hypothetical protein SASPL_131120 [Salvia splendens]|uniref:Uncharacterized protein n=1 Tax=Salvia splendens TaxID=180675 RepID=A0A8X8ZKB1_SALSN|nr:hypothetical protein SASPL_131120 [Salvia splendens]
MSIQSQSADLLRVEETFRNAMGDLFSRLDESNRRLDESIRRRHQADRRYDRTLKELRDDFPALDVQNTALMAKFKAGSGGNSAATSIGLNVRAQCFATHQSEPRDKSVEECIPRFPAEISNFIALNVQKSASPMLPQNLKKGEKFMLELKEEVAIEDTEKETTMMNSTQTVEVMEGVWMEETENETVVISEERELTTGCGYENVEVFEEEVWMEEAAQETVVMKLQESSSHSEAQPAGNLGEVHIAARSQSPSEVIGKRNFEIQSVKQELISHELAYKITIGVNGNRCEENEISETEQRDDASAVVVKQHHALTKSIALAAVETLSEETEKREVPLEGSYELTSSTQESKREQNFGALTNAKSMNQKLDHHKYLMSFLTRMEGDCGVCTYASHTSHSIRNDCSMDLNLLGSLPWDGSYSFFLPAHHKCNLSAFGHMVWVLLTGKSPYSHNLVIMEEPRHRIERILQVSKEHYYRTKWFLLHSMRMFGCDIKYLCIASGAILIEAGGCKVLSHYGDRHPGGHTDHAEHHLQLNGDDRFFCPRPNALIWKVLGEKGRFWHCRKFNKIKEHIRREAWRCVYDSFSLLLVILDPDSAFKLHQPHISSEGSEKTFAGENFNDRLEAIAILIPKPSRYGGIRDIKTVEWTELVCTNEEASITVDAERHLLGTFWCKWLEARLIFTTDLGSRLKLRKLWKLFHHFQFAYLIDKGCYDVCLIVEKRRQCYKIHLRLEAGGSKLLCQRRSVFKLSKVILEFGNSMKGGIEQALHKIEVPKHLPVPSSVAVQTPAALVCTILLQTNAVRRSPKLLT